MWKNIMNETRKFSLVVNPVPHFSCVVSGSRIAHPFQHMLPSQIQLVLIDISGDKLEIFEISH